MLASLVATSLASVPGSAEPTHPNTYLELKTWYLHNTPENQAPRLSEYLQHGLAPALDRAGAKLAGAFSVVVGPDSPYILTLTQFSSLTAMQDALTKLSSDQEHTARLQSLSAGSGLPFVRVNSSLLRSFDVLPQVAIPPAGEKRETRLFELRRYESQTFTTLTRKVGMFNGGEAKIFQKLGMRPVFFGETLVGDRQPNLMYMLTYDSWAAREELWKAFGSDPDWKKLSTVPELKDAEIVANISNVLLHPLPFSLV